MTLLVAFPMDNSCSAQRLLELFIMSSKPIAVHRDSMLCHTTFRRQSRGNLPTVQLRAPATGLSTTEDRTERTGGYPSWQQPRTRGVLDIEQLSWSSWSL